MSSSNLVVDVYRLSAELKDERRKCAFCGVIVEEAVECPYCGKTFCQEHHLPPSHDCENIYLWYNREIPTLQLLVLGRRLEAVRDTERMEISTSVPEVATPEVEPKREAERVSKKKEEKVVERVYIQETVVPAMELENIFIALSSLFIVAAALVSSSIFVHSFYEAVLYYSLLVVFSMLNYKLQEGRDVGIGYSLVFSVVMLAAFFATAYVSMVALSMVLENLDIRFLGA